MIPVTMKQRRMLNFIEEFLETKKYCPTFQEIADGLGLKSLATVHKHLTNLQKKGCLTRSPNLARSMEIPTDGAPPPRFEFEGPHRLWDRVAQCYWVKEGSAK